MSSYFDFDIFGTNVSSRALCKQRKEICREGKERYVKNKKQKFAEEKNQKLCQICIDIHSACYH